MSDRPRSIIPPGELFLMENCRDAGVISERMVEYLWSQRETLNTSHDRINIECDELWIELYRVDSGYTWGVTGQWAGDATRFINRIQKANARG